MSKFLIAILLISSFCFAADFVVTSGKEIDNNENTLTLLEALDIANANGEDDTITFQVGKVTNENGQMAVLDDGGQTINFIGNVTLDGGGDAVNDRVITIATGATANFTNVKFQNANETADGGGVFVDDGATASFVNCKFQNLLAGDEGGALHIGGTVTEITNCKFIKNNCSGKGGGAINVLSTGVITVIQNCTFNGNNTTNDAVGGAIKNLGIIDLLDSCKFTKNTSQSTGGAIAEIDGSISQALDCNFTANRALLGGGAYFATGTTDSEFFDCVFKNNVAQDNEDGNGGAVRITEEAEITFDVCVFQNNKAQFQGGGIFCNGNLILSGCDLFKNNIIDGGDSAGGIFVADSGQLSLEQCSLRNNVSKGVGGGSVNQGTFVAINSTYSANNSNGNDGGGHFNDGGGSVFAFCSFVKNKAADDGQGDGGGIFSDSGDVTLSNSLFDLNTGNNGKDLSGASFTDDGFNLIFDADGGHPFTDGVNSNIVGVKADIVGGAKTNGNDGVSRTHALKNGSPAIDAGDDGANPGVDQRDFARDDLPDIGAFEFDAEPIVSIKTLKARARLSTDKITLTWQAKGYTSFYVWKKLPGERKFQRISSAIIANGETCEFVDMEITQNSSRNRYKIEAVNLSGSSLSNNIFVCWDISVLHQKKRDNPITKERQKEILRAIKERRIK